jgi:hypothetical protein
VLTSESGAIAHVHAGRTIHVIGVSPDGAYLQVGCVIGAEVSSSHRQLSIRVTGMYDEAK